MLMNPTNQTQQSAIRKWVLRADPWVSAGGVVPSSAPPGTLPLAVGLDARQQGSFRRNYGNVPLLDLSWNQDPTNSNSYPIVVDFLKGAGDYEDRILECHPFLITRGRTSIPLWGFVVKHAPITVRLRPWQTTGSQPGWLYPSVGTEHYSDSTGDFFVSLVVYDPTEEEWYWRSLRTPSRYPYASGEFEPTSAGGSGPEYLTLSEDSTLAVTAADRFIYIACSGGDFDPVVVWYDEDLDTGTFTYPGCQGWRWERMGPYFTDALLQERYDAEVASMGGSATGNDAGFSLAAGGVAAQSGAIGYGKQQFRFRLIDHYRYRITGLSPHAERLDFGAGDNYLANYRPQCQVDDAEDARQILRYKYLQAFGSVPAEGSIDYGGPYFLIDTVTTNLWFQSWPTGAVTGGGNITIVNIDMMRNPTLRSRFDPQNASGTRYLVGSPDLRAVGIQYDPALDTVGDPPTVVYDWQVFKGALVAVSNQTTPPDASGTMVTAENEEGGYAAIVFSSLRGYQPEVFPPINVVYTRVPLGPKTRLIPSGNYMLLVGHGPIVRVDRAITTMDVSELPVSASLLSRFSCCDVSGKFFMVSAEGAMVVDPVSGAVQTLSEFDRYIRDYILPEGECSCVYDNQTATIYVQLKRLCLAYNTNTRNIVVLDGYPFRQVVSVAMGNNEKRAVFVSPWGRFVYPRTYEAERPMTDLHGNNSEDPITVAYTSMGAFRYARGSTTPTCFNLSVAALSHTGGVTTIEVEVPSGVTQSLCPQEIGGTNNNSGDHMYGWPVFVHSGDLEGTYFVIVNANTGVGICEFYVSDPNEVIRNGLAVGDILSVAPVVFTLVGAQLETASNYSDPLTQRTVRSITPVVMRPEGTGWDASVDGAIHCMRVGISDYRGFVGHLPVEPPTGSTVEDWRSPVWTPTRFDAASLPLERGALPNSGTPWNADRPHEMVAHIDHYGSMVFPFVYSLLSDFDMEIHQVVVQGRIDSTEISA